MRTTRSFLGLFMALLPILWFGGLFLYLNNVRGAFGGLLDGALGPTLMGLGTILIILVFLFLLKFWRAATPPATGSGARANALGRRRATSMPTRRSPATWPAAMASPAPRRPRSARAGHQNREASAARAPDRLARLALADPPPRPRLVARAGQAGPGAVYGDHADIDMAAPRRHAPRCRARSARSG